VRGRIKGRRRRDFLRHFCLARRTLHPGLQCRDWRRHRGLDVRIPAFERGQVVSAQRASSRAPSPCVRASAICRRAAKQIAMPKRRSAPRRDFGTAASRRRPSAAARVVNARRQAENHSAMCELAYTSGKPIRQLLRWCQTRWSRETCSADAGNEPMFSNMPAAIVTSVGPIRPAIVFEVVIYAPLRMRHRAYDKPGSVPSS
jgi:hypothetical protein